ncbi:MAG: hypothetical protein WAM28_08410 [Chlamydiales bacterium]
MACKKKIIYLVLGIIVSHSLKGADFDLKLDKKQQQELRDEIAINNRILIKIYGKPISVIDVVRKMDMLFYQQYPELIHSSMARYQYYSMNWRYILQTVMEDQLIMLDAEEKKVEVNDGEVREELERLFGPDVVFNLDKMGLTLPEAFVLVKTELTVQRMMAMMVRSKALAEVNPKEIRQVYEQYLKEHPPQDKWTYQTLTIRGNNHQTVAEQAAQLLSDQQIPFTTAIAQLQGEYSLSEEYCRTEEELSTSHKAILQTLAVGTHSLPITQGSASRIFILKAFEKGKAPPFKELEEKMKQQLTQEAMIRNNQLYRDKLRKHYDLTEKYLAQIIPDDLAPFTLR